MPEFVLPPIAGVEEQGFANSDLKSEVTLVNFFASWCVPCLAEHPLITRLAKDEGFRVYGVNYKDETDNARKWLAKHGNPYTRTGSDIEGRVAREWGVTGLPETFIVDRSGVIRFKQVGPITPDILEREIIPALRRLKE